MRAPCAVSLAFLLFSCGTTKRNFANDTAQEAGVAPNDSSLGETAEATESNGASTTAGGSTHAPDSSREDSVTSLDPGVVDGTIGSDTTAPALSGSGETSTSSERPDETGLSSDPSVSTSGESSTSEPDDTQTGSCRVVEECDVPSSVCQRVECTDGRCVYQARPENETCGASLECSEERCVRGECVAVPHNDSRSCGSNVFCGSQGTCQRGSCQSSTGSNCTYTLTGAGAPDPMVTYNGEPAYAMGDGQTVRVEGTLVEKASFTFQVYLPAYNANSMCGPGQPKAATLWIQVRSSAGSSSVSHSNYLWPENGGWLTIAPITIGPGVLDIKLTSGESDGCGWPEDTKPIFVSAFDFQPIDP